MTIISNNVSFCVNNDDKNLKEGKKLSTASSN